MEVTVYVRPSYATVCGIVICVATNGIALVLLPTCTVPVAPDSDSTLYTTSLYVNTSPTSAWTGARPAPLSKPDISVSASKHDTSRFSGLPTT